ncbi:UDP-N-acetylmuramoyl-tripeptide--D-alanyl-D-alanine ligase [Neobacillus rhizosphaerae]|uniref:UDP-N-acetylmuramoyl-tripeptide--D-alanyl-D-alanine ligase n=1 Tax=Neobacillus rhizosphaerae TaxID=2880965 RepID=A0ABM9EPP1_9BACI|nr:YheC/YheD family protein [Neobacillus rhizosphaerae]CAH2714587.1 UDP-N-acetylmuramoyl-tripeptide--D-alanyl-D-alanine ligase [Neobacillus rhizosphaerae]
MTLIGMLHHRKDPKTVIKSYAYAAVAKAEGAKFFFFSPGAVNFVNSSIKGQVYENGIWVERIMPFPDVIYNAGSPEKLAKSKEIIQRLKEKIPFTTHSIGNKWNINERLKEAKEFSNYLIPTEIVIDTEHFFKFVTAFEKVVFKPIDGRKGKGIFFISKSENGFLVTKDSDRISYSKQQLNDLIGSKLSTGTFIIQPYIQSTTKSGQVFDFRLHVQKNGEGKWVITTIYPRVAPMGSIIANINNGGFTNYLDPFLQQEFKEEAFNIKRTLEHFSLSLANHLDELQMLHYGEVIDEIGVDVGLDENSKIWIYEVNWRPGCPPAFYLELDVVINTIRYAVFLAKNQHTITNKIKSLKKKKMEEKKEIPIIAVTGSAGKTTSKAFLASILSKKWNIFESKDYWNTTEHTKKHAAEINPAHEAIVLEYGMAYPGVITEHCSIIKPNISIVTNIGLAHVGNFEGDIKKVAHAKSELIHGMDQNGVLFLNKDDPNSTFLETQNFKGRIITIGVNSAADYSAYDVKYVDTGMNFKMKLQGQEVSLFIPILGEHHVYNALNAIAVADYLGFTPMEIKLGLLFRKPPRRLTIYNCRDNITLIDDTVHSHPQGVRAAIDVLSNIGKHRKIAIIGQMRELGNLREEEYRKVGEYVFEKEIDLLITYGFRTDEIGTQAKTKGLSAKNVYHFTNREQLHELLLRIVKKDDTILIKGASKTNMFDTVKFLDQTFS